MPDFQFLLGNNNIFNVDCWDAENSVFEIKIIIATSLAWNTILRSMFVRQLWYFLNNSRLWLRPANPSTNALKTTMTINKICLFFFDIFITLRVPNTIETMKKRNTLEFLAGACWVIVFYVVLFFNTLKYLKTANSCGLLIICYLQNVKMNWWNLWHTTYDFRVVTRTLALAETSEGTL